MMFKKIIFMATLTAIPVLAAANTRPAATSQRVLFSQLAQQCGKDVHPDTLQAVARVESQFNPYAIGVVNGALPRQPRNMAEAVAAAKMLHAQGRNFSMGLMQVNRYNLAAYGLNYETVFQPCNNIRAGAAILSACFKRAGGNGQVDLQKAFSCYYSGNFKTGFRADFKGRPCKPSPANAGLQRAGHQHVGNAGFARQNVRQSNDPPADHCYPESLAHCLYRIADNRPSAGGSGAGNIRTAADGSPGAKRAGSR